MPGEEVLIANAIISLVNMGMKYKEAKEITADQIRAEVEKSFSEFEARNINRIERP